MAARWAVPVGFRRYLVGRRGFYALLGAAAVVQVTKGLLKRSTLTPPDRSYWFVTYAEGFTRRGLGGAAIQAVTGSVATVSQIETVAWLIAAITLALLAILVIVALRRKTLSLDLAAIALCCSPVVIPFIVTQRRPDELGVIVLLAYGLVLYRSPQQSLLVAGVAGLALAAAVLVADSVFLECLPWVAVVTLLAAARERRSRVGWQLILSCAPAVVVAAISVFVGRLDTQQVHALTKLAGVRHAWVELPNANSNFFFLGDSLGQAASRVASQPMSFKVGSFVALFVALGVQGALMSGFRRPRFAPADRDLGIALRTALLSTLLALGALMTIGLDFARWMTSYGLFATVTYTFFLLYARPNADEDRRPMRTIPVLLAATYLLLLWPINDWFDLEGGVRFLLMMPR